MSARNGRGPVRDLWIAALVAVALGSAVPARAGTGETGRIVFSRGGDVWSADPDGTDEARLTSGPEHDRWPRWSPEGSRIAAVRDGDLVLLLATGAPLRELTTLGDVAGAPSWSPDGLKIAYVRASGGIAIVDATQAGSNGTTLDLGAVTSVAWNPLAADQIAYTDGGAVFTVRPDGSEAGTEIVPADPDGRVRDELAWDAELGQMVFTSTGDDGTRIEGAGVSLDGASRDDQSPAWLPDGQGLLFARGGILHLFRREPFPGGGNVRSLGPGGATPDGQPGLVTSAAAYESGTDTQLVFRVRPVGGAATSVGYQTVPGAGTAVDGVDYSGAGGNAVTPDPFGHPATIPISVSGDGDAEQDETFFVDFTFPSDPAAPLRVRGTILNDDGGRNGIITSSGEHGILALDPVRGAFEPIVPSAGSAVFSPSGDRLAYVRTGGGPLQLVVGDPSGQPLVTFPLGGPIDDEIAWSPDGARLAWTVGATLWVADPAHPASAASIATGAATPSWSNDPGSAARRLAFARVTTGMVCTIREDGSGESCPTAGSQPRWSPDNATIAYLRDNLAVFLMNPDGTNVRLAASAPGVPSGGRLLRWSPRGGSFAFMTGSALFIGEEGTAPTRAPGLPPVLWSFDWSPDGNQLAVRGDTGLAPSGLWIVGPDEAGAPFASARQIAGVETLAEGPRWSSAPVRPIASLASRGGIERFQQARVEVELSAASPDPVTLDWATVDTGSATPDVDYTQSAGTVTLEPGETTGAILIPLLNDVQEEGPESFDVRLTSATGVRLGPVRQVAVFITDDDGSPVAVSDVAATAVDTPVDIAVLANDRDPDGDPLSLIAVGAPAHGTATLAGDLVSYTPQPGFDGVDLFLYAVSDDDGHTATGVVSVYVGVPSPPPPVLTVSPAFLQFGTVPLNKTKDLVVTVANDTAQPVALAETFLIEQADPRPFDATDFEGCRSPAARVLDPGQSCTQRVRFWSVPGAGGASPATARLLDGVTFETVATVALFAATGPPDSGPNLPPVAVDDLAGVAPGFTHLLDALRNDSDPDHDILRITAVSDPPHGTAAVVSCGDFLQHPAAFCVQYVPDAGYTGTDALTYTASDGRGGTATATFHLAVGNVVPSVAAMTPGAGPTMGGQAVRITGSGFVHDSAADFICPGGVFPLAVSRLTETEILATTPPAPAGVCAVRVRTRFGQQGQLASAYRYSDAPVAENVTASTDEAIPVVITLRATDPNGDALTFSIVAAPTHGALSAITGDQVTYTPDGDYHGQDAFTFKASDGVQDSNVATVTITVRPIEPSIVVIDVAETIHVTDEVTVRTAVVIEVAETVHVSDAVSLKTSPLAQNGAATIGEDASGLVPLLATDADGDAFTLVVVNGPAHGTLFPPPGVVMPSGTLVTYTPAPNYFGPDGFTFKARDVQGDSNLATVSIVVAPAPDPPGAAPDGPFVVTAGATLTVPPPGVLLNDADLDFEPLTARQITPPEHGTLTLASDGGFTYVPAAGFSGQVTFTYVASDGLFDSNPAPVAIVVHPAPGREVVTGGVPAGGTLTTDTEGDGATPEDVVETAVLTPQGGQVTIDEGPAPAPLPTAFTFLPLSVELTAPPGTPNPPLLLTFLIDASAVSAAGGTLATLAVFRNGFEVPPCRPGSTATPDPCLALRQMAGDDVRLMVRTSRASVWTFGVPRSTSGLATGALRPRSGGTVAFAATKVHGQLVGALTYQKGSEQFLALRLTALAVEDDGHTAWFAGLGADGRAFLAYAEDHGASGDRFRLWIGGVEKTGGGGLASGKVVVVP